MGRRWVLTWNWQWKWRQDSTAEFITKQRAVSYISVTAQGTTTLERTMLRENPSLSRSHGSGTAEQRQKEETHHVLLTASTWLSRQKDLKSGRMILAMPRYYEEWHGEAHRLLSKNQRRHCFNIVLKFMSAQCVCNAYAMPMLCFSWWNLKEFLHETPQKFVSGQSWGYLWGSHWQLARFQVPKLFDVLCCVP